MATTGKIRSNAINVYLSTNSGDTLSSDTDATNDTFEIIASATSGTFSGELETIDATSKDNDGARSILVSAISWTMTCEGLVVYGDTTNKVRPAELFSLWQNKKKVRLAWATGIAGDVFYYGDAYLTSYEESAGLNEVATFSVTFEGDGDITTGSIDTGAGGQTFYNSQY